MILDDPSNLGRMFSPANQSLFLGRPPFPISHTEALFTHFFPFKKSGFSKQKKMQETRDGAPPAFFVFRNSYQSLAADVKMERE